MKNMHHSEIVLYLLVLFHGGLGVLLFWINPHYFHEYYVKEDGILGWLGFDALALTAILSFYRLRLWRQRSLTFSLGVLLTGLLFTWGAAEEISYGQRLFNYTPPSFLQRQVVQASVAGAEATWHATAQKFALPQGIWRIGLALVAVLYLFGTPFLYRHARRVKDFADRGGIPIPEPFHGFFFLLLILLTFLIKGPGRQEILEFGGSWICFLLVLYPQNEDIFADQPKLQD